MEDLADIEVEDVRQSIEYGRYIEKIGWRVESGIFLRKLGPVTIAKIQRRDLPPGWEKILKRNRVVMCKYEPLRTPVGWRQDNWPLLGTKTLRVDLRPSEEKIFNSFKKDCRYIVRKLQDTTRLPDGQGYKIQTDDFEGFYEIWRKSAKRKHLWIPGKKEFDFLVDSFGEKCFCATINGEAGAVILTHEKTAFYYYAGATEEGNRMNLPYLVVWEAMKEAKRRGMKVWDFEGIYDSRWPNKGWLGFSHFKKSFGGVEVEYPGCFTRWQVPF
ncbi:hypothetical protein A2634_00860 [Candidatus Amesbacteria bacterium RIFCSPHIGHO2_01_FULL_48_32]|uniref:BioF2-like acetyltransferase domain-containing protein n=1 Tax=Candidatus Amesbacteria bacterium RIFCSPLOWO2_01_FULL_48_25 TaxID=1797259 RepID=A0A1F4ZBP8_9BACT|nr:MAG: hypothetical protein A2634_00860 [Candidatus Amesbacteria bacterium RIFCSPHIGHO2_01_FULL_48_32]OGD03356.1 MAG: hypothetical protein A2989_00810 [Candidatus Amesbacteria bacterium RIFCSPLOWO2_01_FULL_48_25]HJZ05310.1 peptidoglycan bridge formation glycyltransferase FemA/FemB family protein [Patescibacteria group bacterium]